MISLNFPTTVAGAVVYLVGLVILWVIVSVPVYFAGKAVTKGKSDFGDAMGATLGGTIVYFIALWGVSYFLGAVLGGPASVFALIIAVLAWLAVYRVAFRTSWIRAVGIVGLSWLILVAINFVAVHFIGVSFPQFFPFT